MKRVSILIILAFIATNIFAQKGTIVFTHKEYANFDAAKPHAIKEVKDGDDLWMYAKFDKPMSSFIEEKDAYGNPAYYLRLAIGAAGNETDWSESEITLNKQKAAANEIAISLSPAIPDRMRANAIFVHSVGKGQPGVWKNSIRIKTANGKKVAEGEIIANVPDDIQRYKKIAGRFESILDGKSVYKEKAPKEEKPKDAALISMVKDAVKKKGINASKVYFTTDTWRETFHDDGTSTRSLAAAYLYTKGKDCIVGRAFVETKGNPKTKKYGPNTVRMGDEKLIDCD